MRVSIGTTASCALGIKWKMANPSTAPVGRQLRRAHQHGLGLCSLRCRTIKEAFAASPRSNEAAKQRPRGAEVVAETPEASVSGPLPLGSTASPNKLKRAVAASGAFVDQRKRRGPVFLGRDLRHRADEVQTASTVASCSTMKGTPPTVIVAERSRPRIRWPLNS